MYNTVFVGVDFRSNGKDCHGYGNQLDLVAKRPACQDYPHCSCKMFVDPLVKSIRCGCQNSQGSDKTSLLDPALCPIKDYSIYST